MISRRRFLRGLSRFGLGALALSSYGIFVEPLLLGQRIRQYDLKLQRWPSGLGLSIAVIADLHACDPWMDVPRIEQIVDQTNKLGADLIVLLGDYASTHRFARRIDPADWARPLGKLKAPLGVHAILGNHDWWDDRAVQAIRRGPPYGKAALEHAGIPVYENDVVRLTKDGRSFWLAGLGDQLAFWPMRRHYPGLRWGIDDLTATLAKVKAGEPVILLAHEPDILPRVPEHVSLVLSGHTHGGQVRLAGWSPVVPSIYGNRFAYGHVREQCDLIVSGGLGCSIAPVRLGVPPEIVLVKASAAA
ncbi:MAG: metallophosphoesterase [Alphaproteobacteria bacterium]|nr:metallophosphoesterase [Alphaproteobacteria bacterium]